MIKVVVIEDEMSSRQLLRRLLTDYCSGLHICGEAENVHGGTQLIQSLRPDLVLLDVELPDGNGFDIIQACQDIAFVSVFITGHDQYAIKAIKHAVFDYILKPIHIRSLQIAIKRVKNRLGEKANPGPCNPSNITINEKLILQHNGRNKVISCDEIWHVEAKGTYSMFYLSADSKILMPYSLSHYEDVLPDYFCRIHRSFLVNLNMVERYDSGRGGQVWLNNHRCFPIAYRRKKEFIEQLQRLTNKA